MKKRNRFRNYLTVEAVVILLVILSFRIIPDKKLASVLTSLIFIGSSLGILYWESRFPGFQKRPSFWGVIVFLVFSALPIFIVRLLYWDLTFDEIQIAGVTGAQMHRASNSIFMLMLIGFFVDSYLEQTRLRKEREQSEA